MKTTKTIAVLNSKGGAAKSTFALQVAATYFLSAGQEVELYEFDDQNKDAEKFKKTAIQTKQIKVGDGSAMSNILRETILDCSSNLIIDVGGNKTTDLFIKGLKKSFLYKKIDLIIIPMSGGSQDIDNADKMFTEVKDFGVPILFGLGRVRNLERLQYQYQDFFLKFPNQRNIVMTDSDVIDLSRDEGKSVYELATDDEYKKIIENELIAAFETQNNTKAKFLSFRNEVYDESKEYFVAVLQPAWKTIADLIEIKNKKQKDTKCSTK